LERRVLAQHQPFELAERRRRVDPELVREHPAQLLVARERLRVAARAVEREHVLRAEALAQRVLRDERLELADHVAVPTEREAGLQPPPERVQAQLLEPRLLAARERLRELRERTAAPERERVGEKFARGRGVAAGERAAGRGDRPLEADEVELVVAELEQVAGRPRLQPRLRQRLSQ